MIIRQYIKILLICLGFSFEAHAYKKQVDSLAILLRAAVSDSEKVRLLIKISDETRADNPKVSLNYTHEAAILAKKINWPEGTAIAYEHLAFDYFELKKTDSAIYFAKNAASIYERLKTLKEKARIYILLGRKLMRIQKYADAKFFFIESLELYIKLSNKEGELTVLQDVGWLYHNIGNYEESNLQFDKAYTLAKQLKDTETLAHLNAAYANNYIALRNYKLAQKKYFESARFFKKQGDLDNYATYLASAANLYRRLNQLEKAQKPLLEAYKIAKRNNHEWNICTITRYLGMLYTDLGKYSLVEDYLKESHRTAIKLNSNSEIIKAYYALERFYYLRQDLINGDKYQKLIISMRDSLYNAESALRLAEFDVKYKTTENEKLLVKAQLDIARKRNLIFGISAALSIILFASVILWYIQKIGHTAKLKDLSLQHIQKELQTREQERQRIAKDLHDSLGSQLTIVSTSLDNACFLAEKNRLTIDRLDAINADVREAVQSLRDIIWATDQTTIRVSMLYARMQQYLMKIFAEQEQILYKTTFLGEDKDLNAVEALNLFRIFQEAIQNTLKHARASSIELLFESYLSVMKLKISDNGSGFDIGSQYMYESFGLRNMKVRSEEINAELKIVSNINQGTTIEIVKK